MACRPWSWRSRTTRLPNFLKKTVPNGAVFFLLFRILLSGIFVKKVPLAYRAGGRYSFYDP